MFMRFNPQPGETRAHVLPKALCERHKTLPLVGVAIGKVKQGSIVKVVEPGRCGSAVRSGRCGRGSPFDTQNAASACRFIAVVVSVIATQCSTTGFVFVISDDVNDLVDENRPSQMNAILRHGQITAAAWFAE